MENTYINKNGRDGGSNSPPRGLIASGATVKVSWSGTAEVTAQLDTKSS